MIVVLVPAAEAEPTLRPAAVSKLARRDATSVAMLGDERTLGLVVEGWAFDPERSTGAVVEALAGRTSCTRTLLPLVEMAVSTARGGGL